MNQSLLQPRILVYQSLDSSIMEDYLRYSGFEVISSSKEDIKEKIKKGNYDLCIIDHYNNSLELLDYTRKINSKIPAIIVSAKYNSSNIITALDAGADDYIVIPYNLNEVIYRIKALLRRAGIRSRGFMENYKIGNYEFDVKASILTIDSATIKLTTKECQVLALLCAYKNETLPKQIIMQQIWKDDNFYSRRSLDVHISNLRNDLKQDSKIAINTIRGIGYSLVIAE